MIGLTDSNIASSIYDNYLLKDFIYLTFKLAHALFEITFIIELLDRSVARGMICGGPGMSSNSFVVVHCDYIKAPSYTKLPALMSHSNNPKSVLIFLSCIV